MARNVVGRLPDVKPKNGQYPYPQSNGISGKNPAMTLAERIRARLEALGQTQASVARDAGLTPDYVRDVLRGHKKTISSEKAAVLSQVLECSIEWLLTGAGDEPGKILAKRMIPVVGYVGAGAEVYSMDDHEKGGGIDEVEVPFPGVSRSTVAVRVRGRSMLPAYHDGDLIFYDQKENGDLLHLLGRECIVRLSDGRTFIKTLKRSPNGDWYLFSYNAEPIMEIEIEWAAKVEWIKRA